MLPTTLARSLLLLAVVAACDVDAPAEPDAATAAAALTLSPGACATPTARRWRAPVAISNESGGALIRPAVANSANGTAMTVWFNEGTIYASRYARTTGVFATWQATPSVLSRFTFPNTGARPVGPDVAMDAAGNAIAAWIEYPSATAYVVKASRFAPSTGWTAPTQLGSATLTTTPAVKVAADAAGVAIVTWESHSQARQSSLTYRVWSGNEWSQELLLSGGTVDARMPRLVASPAGGFLAAWSAYGIYTRRFTAGVGWGAITRIDSAGGGAVELSAAISPTGAAVVAWLNTALWTNVSTTGGAWRGAQIVDGAAGQTADFDVALDPAGTGVIAWSGAAATGTSARRILADGTLLPAATLPRYGDLRIGADADGDVELIGTAPTGVHANRLDHRAASFGCPEQWSWGTDAVVTTATTNVFGANLAVSADGTATAVWRQLTPVPATWAARYY